MLRATVRDAGGRTATASVASACASSGTHRRIERDRRRARARARVARLALRLARAARRAAARARRGGRRRVRGLRRLRSRRGRATSRRACLERIRQVKLLVNNAGIPARATFLDGDPERIEQVMRTNYLGGVWCLRAFLPGLEAARPSDVVNVVSVAGTVAFPPSGPYSASKHAQLAFSRATSASLRRRGISVHTVNPGFVETEGFPQRAVLRQPVLPPRRARARGRCAAHRGPRRQSRRARRRSRAGTAGRASLQAVAPNLVARLIAAPRRHVPPAIAALSRAVDAEIPAGLGDVVERGRPAKGPSRARPPRRCSPRARGRSRGRGAA